MVPVRYDGTHPQNRRLGCHSPGSGRIHRAGLEPADAHGAAEAAADLEGGLDNGVRGGLRRIIRICILVTLCIWLIMPETT
jgi:hypothetical protein